MSTSDPSTRVGRDRIDAARTCIREALRALPVAPQGTPIHESRVELREALVKVNAAAERLGGAR